MHISDSIKIGFQYFQLVASRSGRSSFAQLTEAIPSEKPSFESIPLSLPSFKAGIILLQGSFGVLHIRVNFIHVNLYRFAGFV